MAGNVQRVYQEANSTVTGTLYGTAAIGGSVNIVTQNASNEPGISTSGTWGSYNTRRLNLSYASGIVNNRYSTYGRFSKVESDGYRRDSWVDAWSYFLSASR